MRFSRNTERLLLIIGVLLILTYAAAYVHRTILFRAELRRFQDSQRRQPGGIPAGLRPAAEGRFDFSTWSETRIAAYEHTLAEHIDPPLAMLRISKVHLEVPVLEGTDDLILNRGVGHILGTVRPGEDGTSELPAIGMDFLGCSKTSARETPLSWRPQAARIHTLWIRS